MSANMDQILGSNATIPDSITTLGEAIRFLREQRGMSLRDLAERVGVSAPFLSDLERNRRATDRLEQLADTLGVPAGTLRQFDTRLTPDVRDWIASSPGVSALLREMKKSGMSVDELRAAFR